jgi:hypothetical protein
MIPYTFSMGFKTEKQAGQGRTSACCRICVMWGRALSCWKTTPACSFIKGNRTGLKIPSIHRWAFNLPLIKTKGDLYPIPMELHTISHWCYTAVSSYSKLQITLPLLNLLTIIRRSFCHKQNPDSSLNMTWSHS